jgi:hypothetical protein
LLPLHCLNVQVPFYAAAACRAATQPGAAHPLANPLAHAAACTVLKTILQSASCAGLFKPQLGSQDTSSNLAVSMLQQLQDAGLMQQLPVSLGMAVEDLRDALVMPTLGSPMLHAYLNRAADMLTITEHVILLHQGLPAVLQAHAVLAPAAFDLITAAMRYLSVHLSALKQQQQPGQQQQEQPTDQKVLLLKGTEVVLAAQQLVATLGKCVFAFGGISGALSAVPRLQQLVDCPRFVPFLVLQLAVVSQGMQQPLQELRASAAAKGSGSRRGGSMLRTRRSNSSSCSGSTASNPRSSSSSSVSTSVITKGEQPLELLQQLQAQQRLPSATPCQQQLFDLLGVDRITLAWASQRAAHSTTYFQGLLRLYREVVNEQHVEEEEEEGEGEEEGEEEEEEGEEEEEQEEEDDDVGAATQWQLHLLLPGVLLPCAARLCKVGSTAAAALGLSMADQALLCRNIARASSASLHVWQSQCGVAGGSRSTLDELQLWLGELRSLLLQVLHEALHAMPQRRQDELRLRLVSLEAPADATPARRAAAAAYFADMSAAAAGAILAPSIDVFADAAVAVAAPDVAGTESGVGAASAAQLQEDLQCRMVVEMAEPWEDRMHAAAELMGRLLLLLAEQEELDGLVQQQDRAAEKQQQQHQQQATASLAGPGEDGAGQQQQQQQAEGSPAGPGVIGAACCSAAAGQQQQCSSQGGVSGGGISRPFPPALSVPAQLPFLCATFERLVRVVAAALTAEGLDVYNGSQATKNALTVVGSSCAVGSGCSASHRGSDLHQGVLTLAVQEAGLGQAGGWQFYSFLCSFVKLCYGFNKQSVLDKGVMWNPFRPACTALHAMLLEVKEGEESDSAPTLDALPSVFIIGRCCLLWADILSAQTANGELALQESSQQQLRSFTHDFFKGLCYTAEAWLHSRSAQLSAAGYPDPESWLQQLRAAEAAAVAAWEAEGEAAGAQCAVLVQELRALGQASCLFAVPLVCNNPRCMSLHGETEVSLVSGRACVCSGCRVARYCGRECLRQHWKQHKPVCKAMAAAAAAAGAGAPNGDAATASAAL